MQIVIIIINCNDEFVKHHLSRQPIQGATHGYKNKSAMKKKHETIPEPSSEQEKKNGISLGLNELYSKHSYTLYTDWNKYVWRRFLNASMETHLRCPWREFHNLGAHEE